MLLKTSITNKCKKKYFLLIGSMLKKNYPCINETKYNDTGSTTQNSKSETSCNVLRLTEESFSETKTKMVTNEVNLEITAWNTLNREAIRINPQNCMHLLKSYNQLYN